MDDIQRWNHDNTAVYYVTSLCSQKFMRGERRKQKRQSITLHVHSTHTKKQNAV